MSSFQLEGRSAVVTGAAGKLGPVWIKSLLEAGANVVGLDVNAPALGQLAERFSSQFGSGRFATAPADVTDRGSLEAARQIVENGFGAAEILVNNAGIDQPPDSGTSGSLIEDVDINAFRQTLDVNLTGTFQASQVFGPSMVERGKGSIVNIGSLYGSISPEPSFYDHLNIDPAFLKPPAYGASKAGVLQLTRYLARLWGPHGVRVNALSPGGVLGGQDEDFKRKFTARVPLRRMAEASDLSGPLTFLASDASAYLTGANLSIDGGFTA